MEKEPQNGTKRTTDGPVSSAKRKKEDKPEKDEVCKSLHLNIANQINEIEKRYLQVFVFCFTDFISV